MGGTPEAKIIVIVIADHKSVSLLTLFWWVWTVREILKLSKSILKLDNLNEWWKSNIFMSTSNGKLFVSLYRAVVLFFPWSWITLSRNLGKKIFPLLWPMLCSISQLSELSFWNRNKIIHLVFKYWWKELCGYIAIVLLNLFRTPSWVVWLVWLE